jgi:hypothetical protein
MLFVFLLPGVLGQCLGVTFSSTTTCFHSCRLLYIRNDVDEVLGDLLVAVSLNQDDRFVINHIQPHDADRISGVQEEAL